MQKGYLVIPVPVLSDNYAYLLIDENTREAAAIDPADPYKVLEAAKAQNAKLKAVLTTHHHADHAQGNGEVAAAVPGIKVIGGDDRITALSHKVGDGDRLRIGETEVEVLATPCHTTGHVLYLVSHPSAQQRALFTGDTLFIAGCGRFFEGDAKQMYRNLIERVATLPQDTQIYCGHEYTEKNLKFALTIEPDNLDIQKKYQWAMEHGIKQQPTVPSTVGEELKTNPFMRVKEGTVRRAVGLEDPIEVMAELRRRKDRF